MADSVSTLQPSVYFMGAKTHWTLIIVISVSRLLSNMLQLRTLSRLLITIKPVRQKQ
jgi:hypothetical protein